MIMTSELAKDSDICKKLVATGCRLRSTHSYLASFLLEEKKYIAKSYWKSYIDILPINFDSIPIFFGAEELKYLKGSFVLEKIADRTVRYHPPRLPLRSACACLTLPHIIPLSPLIVKPL